MAQSFGISKDFRQLTSPKQLLRLCLVKFMCASCLFDLCQRYSLCHDTAGGGGNKWKLLWMEPIFLVRLLVIDESVFKTWVFELEYRKKSSTLVLFLLTHFGWMYARHTCFFLGIWLQKVSTGYLKTDYQLSNLFFGILNEN